MLIKEGTVEYTRPVGASTVRLTLTLDVHEDTPGSAIVWANELVDAWSKDTPGTAVAWANERVEAATGSPGMPVGHNDDREREAMQAKRDAREAAVAPQENPTIAPSRAVGGAAPQSSSTTFAPPAGGMSPDPFAIGAPAKVPAENPTPAAALSSPTTDENSGTSTESASTGPVEVELTDNDMHAAAHLMIERKVPATAIKRITAKYANGSLSIRSIPTEKRAAWLKEVKELKQ